MLAEFDDARVSVEQNIEAKKKMIQFHDIAIKF